MRSTLRTPVARPALALPALVLVLLSGHALAALPVSLDDDATLRPGAPILPDDWLTVNTLHGETRHLGCTANFLFRDDAGNRYVGTAGHCAPVARGVHAWAPGEGPVARHGLRVEDAVPIGRFVFAASTLAPARAPLPFVGFVPEWDLALIRLDPGVEASPQMAHFGGPTGLNADLSPAPALLHHYGWGVHGVNGEPEVSGCCAFEQPAHGRTALAPSLSHPHLVHVLDVAGGGDSGSPVIGADGRAVGIVSSANYADHGAGASGAQTGNGIYVRLGPQLALAEATLGLALTLETAPLR
ncbi:MAG TPA: trypsin-like serine protease [Candidatus Thermoplasmatota archaeon]|nr:trypsin-like serine protease [Candidatus Thermoplasmatota archaeon]